MSGSRIFRLALATLGLGLFAAACGGSVSTGPNPLTIEATPETGAMPLAVGFKAKLQDVAVSDSAGTFAWDFGDGSTVETGSNPLHTFGSLGDFLVKLTLTADGKTYHADKKITVTATGPGVDLSVASVDVSPGSINPGAQITVKATIANSGTDAYTHNFINRIYLTTTPTLDPAVDQPRGTINMSGIQGSESKDGQTTITLPTTFSPSDYWVWVIADSGNGVSETDENNNTGKATSQLHVVSSALPIDLVATAPVVTGTSGAAGTSFNVDTTVSNAGTSDAGAFTVKVMLSPDPTITTADVQVGSVQIQSLAAGGTSPQTIAASIPAGVDNRPWYLGVIVDSQGAVFETNEDNNVSMLPALFHTSGGTGCTEDANEPNDTASTATPVTAGTLSALEVCKNSVDWFRVDLGMGDRLTSRINFQNVNGDLDLSVYAVGDTSNAIAVSNGSSDTEFVDAGYATSPTSYLVKVELGDASAGNQYDLLDAVAQNGGNGIDLVTTALTAGNGSPIPPGNSAAASITLWNFGTQAAGAFDVQLFLSTDATLSAGDVALDSFSVASLASGTSSTTSRSVSIPAGTASGWYYVIAHADSGAAIAETHEENNDFAVQVGVGNGCVDDTFAPNDSLGAAAPVDNGTFSNLQMCGTDDEDWFAVTTGAGGTLDVTITFDSNGHDFDLYLKDGSGMTPSGCSSCSSTGVTSTEHVSFTASTGGTYYVRVLSYSGMGAYSMSVSGSTGAMPDFAPSALTVTPTAITAGDDIQITFTLKNNSTMDAPALQYDVRLSSDTTIGGGDAVLATVDEPAMSAGETRSVTKKLNVPEAQPGGSYYVGVVADPSGAVSEASESNNTAHSASPITVTAMCTDDGFEENDTISTASTMAVGGTTNGLVVCSGDPDYYAFTPSSSGTLTLSIAFTHANGDLDMRLYDGASQALLGSSTGTSDSESISMTVTGGHLYKLKVYGFAGAANGYTMTTTLAP